MVDGNGNAERKLRPVRLVALGLPAPRARRRSTAGRRRARGRGQRARGDEDRPVAASGRLAALRFHDRPPLTRAAGVLLHPTSLPGGRLGPEAERFVDWLAAAGQRWWQILPLVPPDRNGSPYTSPSAFAAWKGLLADPRAVVEPAEIESFRERNAYWAPGWERFAGRGSLADQVRFEREWNALRAYAVARGVRIIGDLPIYVSHGSADFAEHPRLFDESEQAAAAPDPFNRAGQLWGNPLYRWPEHRKERYRWWTERFRRTFELVDVTRVDHFRGFVAAWAVPSAPTIRPSGHWRRGPGAALFRAVERELGPLPIVVEDLGLITQAVYRLRDELGFPGMRVLQFGFDGRPSNPDAPANYPERCVLYTGTHDHDPLRGWWEHAADGLRRRAEATWRAAGIDEPDPVWALIRLAYSTRAELAIVQMQDVLGLGRESRFNTPATTRGNWRWRSSPGSSRTPSPSASARRRLVLDVELGRVLVDERVDLVHALGEGVVDLHEGLPLLGQRVLGEDRLDGALRLAGAAVDALLRVDHEHPRGLVDAVDRADVDARAILDVDAGLRDHVGHRDSLYRGE